MLTVDRLDQLVKQAYRDMGYETVRFRDGSVGVLKCPSKTIALMNRLTQLVMAELEPEKEGA